jgi:PAS domain S-box-containing protein
MPGDKNVNAQAADHASATAPWGRPLISELLESIPDPVIGCDARGHVVYWSRAARDAYGYSSEEATGQPVTILLQTRFPRPLIEIMEEVTDLGRWQGTLVHHTKDGRERTVESRWVARYDDAGTLVGGFGIERQLSSVDELNRRTAAEADRENVERELRRAERLESVGQLAGGVAHDFNNALAIIINYAAFVTSAIERQQTAPDDAQRASMSADLQEIRAAAQRAGVLTQQLLAFSRQEFGAPLTLSLNGSIRELKPLLKRTVGEHIRLVTELAADLCPVRADPAQIQQMLINLAANARDAMPSGGTLTIDTANVELDHETPVVRPDLSPGPYARLRVSDTGIGMAPDVIEQVFDPFFTTKPLGAGTGLGLSSVYGIITRAGGHAQFYSEPNVGTTFVALLPASAGATPAGPPTTDAASDALGEKTILLVEDERALREATRRILVAAGFCVLTAADGAAALELAEGHEAAIDLLLTDIVMPRMVGHELGSQLRKLRPDVRVLYMSGFSESVREQATQIGPAPVIEKPFTAPVLLAHVRRAFTGDARSGQ